MSAMATAASDEERLRDLLHGPDPGTPAARREQLVEIEQLSASIEEAQQVKFDRTMDARRAAQMDGWARAPGVGSERRRDEPPEREAMRKIAYLYRSGMPLPLRLEDFSHGRLTAKESLELLDLAQRAFRGGDEYNAQDIPRHEALLEKACAAAPGAIAQWNEEMTNYDGRWVRNTDVEAYRRARAEFKAAEAKFAAAKSKLPPALWEHHT